MSEKTITPEELDALAAKLDRLDGELTDDERALLSGLLAVAVDRLREQAEDEVSGYSFSFGAQPGGSLGQGFRNSFASGGGGGAGFGGQGGAMPIVIGDGGKSQIGGITIGDRPAGMGDGSV